MTEAATPKDYTPNYIGAAGKVFESGVGAMSANASSKAGIKEKKRRRKASEILERLKNRLSAKNDNRESQNQMTDAYAELLANKAAQFRQSVS